MRTSTINRKTAETDISLFLDLESTGSEISTSVGFFDHMLTLFARHAGVNLKVKCVGDIEVDFHHTVEDVGICLGLAFKEALGDKRGIERYGQCFLPMDEALVYTALDISGRGMSICHFDFPSEKIGDFDTELVAEFFSAFARCSEITLHVNEVYGDNSHHIAEAAFKGFARAMKQAIKIVSDEIPSTKGVL